MAFHPFSEAEALAFLRSEPPHTGKLATVRADGRPHVAPIWYLVDDDGAVVFNTGESTVKGKNLLALGQAALCVDDERPPFAFLTVEGPVEISRDPGELLRTATAIGARYMGPDRAEEFGRRNATGGELVVRLRPDRLNGASDLAD